MTNRYLAGVFACILLTGCTPTESGCLENLAAPTGVSASLTRRDGAAQAAFDHIAGRPHDAAEKVVSLVGDFTVQGWAVDPTAKNTGSAVEVAVDGRPFVAEDRLPRPDVAQAFATPAYNDSGFTFSMPARLIGSGQHSFTVRVIASDGQSFVESPAVGITVQ